jgi:3-phenylpropionate/cinnamic acid dioxygenase small subunit
MADAGTAPAPRLAEVPRELQPFPERGSRRPDLDAELTTFLAEESAAIDERRYREWLELLDPGFIYQMPVPLVREDPTLPRHSERALLFEATKQVLGMKLGRVGLSYAWSDRPSGATRHLVSGVRVFATGEPDTWRVESNVLATWNRGLGESAWASAARVDLVFGAVKSFDHRLLRRTVLLDAEVATHEQLSIIF